MFLTVMVHTDKQITTFTLSLTSKKNAKEMNSMVLVYRIEELNSLPLLGIMLTMMLHTSLKFCEFRLHTYSNLQMMCET